jgi:hypothetical protein
VSTQLLLPLDDDGAQHRHPSHTSNGSYDAAAASAVVALAAAGVGVMDRYTTLRTGTYRSSSLLLLLLAPPACSLTTSLLARQAGLVLGFITDIYMINKEKTCMDMDIVDGMDHGWTYLEFAAGRRRR